MRDINDYETIRFTDKSTNNKRTKAKKIGKYLCLAFSDIDDTHIKIYNIKQGLPIIDATFTQVNDALSVANWLIDMFGEYFPIWDKYPEADVFSMIKWTIPDGIRKYETIKILGSNDRATKEDLAKAYIKAERNVKEWTR